MKKSILSVLLCGAVMAIPGVASADDTVGGYICSVNYMPGSTTNAGNLGVITFTLYSGPNCTGGKIGGSPGADFTICSTVAGGGPPTFGYCASSATYRFKDRDASAVYAQLLSRMAQYDYFVGLSRGTCLNGQTNTCAQNFLFH